MAVTAQLLSQVCPDFGVSTRYPTPDVGPPFFETPLLRKKPLLAIVTLLTDRETCPAYDPGSMLFL